VAGFVPIQVLGEMTSIGTLFAFVVVSLAVIILRVKRPEARRPFRVPLGFTIPILGVVFCVYLMVSLSVMTWVRFLGWLDIGMVIYWFYGRTHSPLVNAAEAAARTGAEKFANFCKVSGYMLLFKRLLHHAAGVPDRVWRYQRDPGEMARAGRAADPRERHDRPEHAHQPGDRRCVRSDDHRGGGRRGGAGLRAGSFVQQTVRP